MSYRLKTDKTETKERQKRGQTEEKQNNRLSLVSVIPLFLLSLVIDGIEQDLYLYSKAY